MNRLVLVMAMAAGLAGGLLMAQNETRGAILGHVKDPASAVVPGAKVSVRNLLTGVVTDLTTDEQGYYEARLIIAGTYQVDVSAAGFKNASRPAFDLPAGQRLEVDFRLEIGSIADSVTVTDTPPLLNADNASAGLVLDQRNVRELPWPGGNPTMLAWMAPGAQITLSISDFSQRLHSGGPAVFLSINGRVGGNESIKVSITSCWTSW